MNDSEVVVGVGPVAAPVRARRSWLAFIASPPFLAGLLVALGAVLRLYQLGSRSFWLDEVFTSQASQLQGLSQVVEWTRDYQLQPLYFGAAWVAAHLSFAGDSEVALRLPSALAGAASVYYGYQLGRTLYTPAVGLLSALLFATMYLPVWYSQEARPYAFMILLAAAQLLYAYRSVRDARARDWLSLAVATLLGLYNHYMALLATAACGLFLAGVITAELGSALRARDRQGLERVVIKAVAAIDTAALVFVGYLPWLQYLVAFLKRGAISSNGYFQRFPTHHLGLGDVSTFLGNLGFEGLLALLLLAGVVAAVRRSRHRGATAAAALLLSAAVPLVVLGIKIGGAVLGVWPRYIAFLLPTGIVLVALGAEEAALGAAGAYRRLARRATWAATRSAQRPALLLVAAVVAVQALTGLIPSYAYQKDQLRQAVGYVLDHGSTDDVILSVGEASSYVYAGLPYYIGRMQPRLLLADGHALGPVGSLLLDRFRQAGVHVWLVVANGDDPNGVRARSLITVSTKGYTSLPPVAGSGLEVTRYVGVTLVRARQAGLPAMQQAIELYRWAARGEPDLQPQLSWLLAAAGPPAARPAPVAPAGASTARPTAPVR